MGFKRPEVQIFSLRPDYIKKEDCMHTVFFFYIFCLRQNIKLPSYGRMYCFYSRKQVFRKSKYLRYQIFSQVDDFLFFIFSFCLFVCKHPLNKTFFNRYIALQSKATLLQNYFVFLCDCY